MNFPKILEKFLRNVKKNTNETKKFQLKSTKNMSFSSQRQKQFGKRQKKSPDFEMFRPYLEKLVEMTNRFVNYWGYEGNRYDVLLRPLRAWNDRMKF